MRPGELLTEYFQNSWEVDMTTKELRDKLIEKRTLYQNAVTESEKACDSLREGLSELKADKESIKILEEYGFDLTGILQTDVNRLTKEDDYLEQFKSQIHEKAEQLQSFLEKQLGV